MNRNVNDLGKMKLHTVTYLAPNDLKKLEAIATAEDLTVSALIRRAVKRFLSETEKK